MNTIFQSTQSGFIIKTTFITEKLVAYYQIITLPNYHIT